MQTGQVCGLTGTAKSQAGKHSNRDDSPLSARAESDIASSVSLSTMLPLGDSEGRSDQQPAARITGSVVRATV